MSITDNLRSRLNEYQYKSTDGRLTLKDVYYQFKKEYDITYEGMRQFWNGSSEGSGKFLNALDNFLRDRGY